MLEAAFVVAPRQNLFFVELQRALAAELEAVGIATSVHDGAFPEPRRGLVYVVMPPHEYFTLMHGRIGPPRGVFERTLFISAEQPTTPFFDWNLHYAPQAGALFDINRLAVRAYAGEGIAAEHLQLGYTPTWDFLPEKGPEPVERDIDVLFMGAASERRLRHLGSYSRVLRNRHCHFVISDNSLPNWAASGSYVADDAKWRLLGRSKVLLNVHQDDTPYFEWLRIVQAMTNGCVVVSEASLDSDPLVAGEHMLTGRPESLGHLAELLLDDPHRRWELQTAAYDFLHDRLRLSSSVERLAAALRRLDERPVPSAQSPFFLQPRPRGEDAEAALARLVPPSADDGGVRRALKDLRLELLDLRRRLDRVGDGPQPPVVSLERESAGWAGASPRISVLLTVYNYADELGEALESLTHSRERSWEVVMVDDGSRDRSVEQAAAWIAHHEEVPALLVRHPVNRGLAAARNSALDFARGELCFVLDADNALYPWCLERLAAALDGDPGAAFAYGMLERFSRAGTVGMSSIYPWQPERFRRGNYIDAMALLRTRELRALGGYRTDPRLYGWEDFDLWCRMAERGMHGVHVPSVVARYRASEHSMLSITNLSGAVATSVIASASPTVMADAVIPV